MDGFWAACGVFYFSFVELVHFDLESFWLGGLILRWEIERRDCARCEGGGGEQAGKFHVARSRGLVNTCWKKEG